MGYLYIHYDGREGKGWSVWAAIVAAIGPAEAKRLPEMRDPFFVLYPDRDADINRMAEVLTEDGDCIGTVCELRD